MTPTATEGGHVRNTMGRNKMVTEREYLLDVQPVSLQGWTSTGQYEMCAFTTQSQVSTPLQIAALKLGRERPV